MQLQTKQVFSQEIQDTTTSKVYKLGVVEISSTVDKDQLESKTMLKYNNLDVATALNKLPSIVIINTGARNESGVALRGFDSRSVPVFIDGIPIYVPYDGTVDLSRFSTLGIAHIQVSKGFSSMTLGPNTLGGAINLVSTKPSEKFDLNLRLGAQSGNGNDGYIGIGTKQDKFYIQTNFSWFKKAFTPLSMNFDTNNLELNYQLDNSYRKDWKGGVKFGFTPNKTDEYSINYIYQHGEKGNPVYLGNDPTQKLRYWQWPYWDKQSLYIINKTKLGNGILLKTRFYYDQFQNKLMSFDDGTYTTQNRRSSFISYYDDNTYGAQAEILYTKIKKNNFKLAVNEKNDIHRQHNEGESIQHFSDNTFSIALEDVFHVSNKLTLIPGISYNIRKSFMAEDYYNKTDSMGNFPENKSHSFDVQLGSYFTVNEVINVNFNIASKTRFASMRDRYSYKLGIALPNPSLVPEKAENFEIAASMKISKKLLIKPEIFYSHLTNSIQLVSNVQGNLSQMQNTGVSEFMGYDLTINYIPMQDFVIYGIWSFIQQKNISNPEILFVNIPKHRVFVSIEKIIKEKLQLIISAEYNSKRFSASDGSRIAPEYSLVNLSAGYRFNAKIRFEAGVNNILDQLYYVDEGYPESGRNFFMAAYYNL